MLKIIKSRSLQGTIEIEGVPVVQLSASITIDPSDFTIYNNGGVNRTILNTDLYRKNIIFRSQSLRLPPDRFRHRKQLHRRGSYVYDALQ